VLGRFAPNGVHVPRCATEEMKTPMSVPTATAAVPTATMLKMRWTP
jgi:hypothetical protein